MGRSIGLFGDTGCGKTTQIGEYAKHVKRTTGKNTLYFSADPGGFESILPLVELGVIRVVRFSEGDDPWAWITDAVAGREGGATPSDIGLFGFDSATGIGEHLLASCADLAASGANIGGGDAPSFTIHKKDPKNAFKVGSNTMSHYHVVQNFLLSRIHRSSWLNANGGPDTLWTFSVLRAEDEITGTSAVLGPKLAGRALTPSLPKYFNYMLRLVSIPQLNQPARHVLNLDEQPELGGLGRTPSNARYPLDATTPLPATLEPASLSKAIILIEGGRSEARETIKRELGL